MNIVNIKGGLGNQLFQYAFGRALQLRTGNETKYDTSGYSNNNFSQNPGDVVRLLGLYDFEIPLITSASEENERLNRQSFLIKLFMKFYRKITQNYNINYNRKYLKQNIDNEYLDGFWQDERYFIDFQEIIRSELTLKKPLNQSQTELISLLDNSISLSLHIRRTDTVSDKKTYEKFKPASLSYYKSAYDYIVSHIHDAKKEIRIFIFTDDPEWAKENITFLSHPTTHVSSDFNLSDTEELIAMSMCNHNIIANSTYSWWGAWLNKNQNKIVVAPTPWVNKGIKDFVNIVPAEWIKLPKD